MAALDPRIVRPGWMHACWWGVCRLCGEVIHGPGSAKTPCPCGQLHPVGEMQALVDVPGHGRAWVHGDCADPPRLRAV